MWDDDFYYNPKQHEAKMLALGEHYDNRRFMEWEDSLCPEDCTDCKFSESCANYGDFLEEGNDADNNSD